MKEINIKLEEYKMLLDFNHEYYGKDLKNNYKFINKAVKVFIKKGILVEEILEFLEDTIKIHKNSYGLLL